MDLTSGLAAASLWGFILTSVLVEITPGPNMVYLAVVAATDGRKPGYAAVAGVALGLAIVGIVAAMGLAAAVTASPVLYQILRWAGALYLLWLAWDGWRGAGEAVEHADLGSSLTTYFGRGLVTNLLNPKAAAFYIAVLPGFVSAGDTALTQTLILSAVYVLVATAIHAAIVTAAGSVKTLLDQPRRNLIVRRVLSVALALVAVWFVWKTA
jgi:threonine/homoserine/homoserine lactone efflux protein